MNKKPMRARPPHVVSTLASALLAAAAVLAGGAALAQGTSQRVAVTSFNVTGNSLLGAAEIDAVLAPFKGERTLADLKAAAAALQEQYRRAGYGAVIAYVPEQTLAGGTATIAVLEGKIAKVVVLGNQQFSADNIRRSLPLLREGQTPHVARLDQQIQLANENGAKQIAVTLEPGAKQGEVDVRIAVTERPVSRWSLSVDNTGNSQTGHLRAALAWRHAALWDLDHQANLQYQTSPSKPDQVSILSASYSVPFYESGIRLDTYAAYSNVDGGNTPTAAGALSFTGKGRVYGLRVNKLLPRLGEVDQRFNVGLDRRAYLNDCRIANQPPGVCGAAGESVTVNPLTIEYVVQRGGGVAAGANISFTSNLDLGGKHGRRADFEAVRPGAPLRYSMWRLGGFVNPELGGDWRLNARLNAQATGDALVSGEQFGLAGANAVRGYEEREVIGDSGAVVSLELLGPDFFSPSAAPGASAQSLRLVAFVDAGQVSNKRGTECRAGHTRCSLSSAGMGLRWANGPGQLRVDVARAGSDGTRTDSGSWKLHLAGSWSFE